VRWLLVVPILVALAVGGLIGTWRLGGPDLRRWVAHAALEWALDRDVEVDGALEVELGVEPLLRVSGLRIDNPPWAEAPTLLKINHTEVRFALWPALQGMLVFPLIDLEGVTVALETAADGRNSWRSEHAPDHGAALTVPLVGRLSVRDATATYLDHRGGVPIQVHLASLNPQPAASGRMQPYGAGGDRGYRLDGLELRLGAAAQLAISAEGTTGPLVAEQPLTTALDLSVQADWPSSEALAPLAGADLPELGSGEAVFAIGGTIGSPRLHDVRVETRSAAGMVMTATGNVASVAAAPFAFEGVELEIEGRAPSTTALERSFGRDMPELGPVHLQANLRDRAGRLRLEAIRLVAGTATVPSLAARGTIGDVLALRDVQLTGDLDVPTTALLALAGLRSGAETGRVHGSYRLSDAGGPIGIELLEVEIRETPLLAFEAAGAIDDLARLDQIRLQASVEVPSIARLAEVLDGPDIALERFRFEGRLSRSGPRLDAEGEARIGETEFDGTLRGDFAGSRPSFEVKLHSPLVRLADLGLKPPVATKVSPYRRNAAARDSTLISRAPLPLEDLRTFDLDLDVQLDSLEGVALAIDRAVARIELVDGRLLLAPLRFEVARGYAQVDAEVDLREPTPTWQVRATSDDIDLGDIWRQLETDVPLGGALYLLADLEASGRSPSDLASSLSGDFSLALQRGKIRSRLFDLTIMNPLRWVIARSTRRGYAEIHCFVARFHADNGLAELQALVLDTPNVIASGEGSIDLARETIDLRIRPRAKQRRMVELPTPFAITGSLADPQIVASTTGATARSLGRVVMTPINVLGSLLPLVRGGGRDQDNPCLALADPQDGDTPER